MERTQNSFEVSLGEKRSDIIQHMFCHFEGAMGFHCNREVTKQMKKEGFISAEQSNDRFGVYLRYFSLLVLSISFLILDCIAPSLRLNIDTSSFMLLFS